MATYDITTTTISPTQLTTGDIINCPYSGDYHSILLPPGLYELECWGAQGGSYASNYAAGGKGGYAKGELTLDEPTALFLYAGGKGSYGKGAAATFSGGGWNGGGNAAYRGGGGGGGSDIRIGSTDLKARVIVAGGGGGSYSYSSSYKAAGGAGGGSNGKNGGNSGIAAYSNFCGQGGTPTAGGASNTAVTSGAYNGRDGVFGVGGDGGRAYSTTYYANGAGGGGWYGGSGADGYQGNSRYRAAGGGGGSGYVYTSSTYSQYPSGCLLNSNYYLDNTSLVAGNVSNGIPAYASGILTTGHSGNGAVRITVLQVSKITIYLKTGSSTWKQIN